MIWGESSSTSAANNGSFRVNDTGSFGYIGVVEPAPALSGSTTLAKGFFTRVRDAARLESRSIYTKVTCSSQCHTPVPASAPTTTDTVAPTLSNVTVPATTATRTITVGITASDNVAVKEVRFANGDGVWGAWQPFAASQQWTLRASASTSKSVYTQVRDAARLKSASIYRRSLSSHSPQPEKA